MSGFLDWVLNGIKQLSELADPGLVKAILFIYVTALTTLHATGDLEQGVIMNLTNTALIMIFISYMFGYVLIDKEYE